jgi:hypothetical protein
MKTVQLPLSIITIDGQTQQRDIDTDRMQEYARLMKEGAVFPPIEVMHDGKRYWLWDGFHRYYAAKETDVKMLTANADIGTQRDAIWKSYSANKHGLPRGEKVLKSIVRSILADDEWKVKPQKEIGEHVGVSQQWISKLISDISEKQTTGVRVKRSKPSEVQDNTQVTEKTEDKSDTGQSTPSENQTKKEEKEEPVMDSVGNIVPKNLRDIFAGKSEIEMSKKELSSFKSEVLSRVEKNPKLWHYFHQNPFTVDIENIRRVLKFCEPYAVCPYCHGKALETCGCKGAGFVNKDAYNAAPDKKRK